MLRDIVKVVCIGLLALVCAGCGMPPTPVPALPTATSEPTPRPTETAAPIPTATLAPTPTPPACPPRKELAYPQRPLSVEQYADTLGDYLAAGGDPRQIDAILEAWDTRPFEGHSVLQADFNRDGVWETVVSYSAFESEMFPPPARLAVYECRGGSVGLMYMYNPGEWLALSLLGVEDMTQDGVDDLTFADVSCGAHTCWHTLHVWSWDGQDFQEQLGGEFTLPYGSFLIRDAQIAGVSGGIGSVGAGPQRAFTETWAWNGQVITRTSSEEGPAWYRYHAFRDGDEALFAEDYDAAYWAYMNVLTDQTLHAWEGFYGPQEEKLWLTALANWRIALMGMKLENYDDAKEHYGRLQDNYLPDTPGYAVAAMAKRFWDKYLEVGNIAYGCQEVVNAPETETVLEFLNSYGYANPLYNAEDLCPYLTP